MALLLLATLGVSENTAAVDAHRLEHRLSPLVAERLTIMLEPRGDVLREKYGVSLSEPSDMEPWPREASVAS
jgi:Mn-dependent DtxR family transcriptional regulator